MDRFGQGRPMMMTRMTVLQMSVTELSEELLRCACSSPELSFQRVLPGVVVSNEFDVVIFQTDDGLRAEIATPLCGDPSLVPPAAGESPEWSRCRDLINSIHLRKVTLKKVIDFLIARWPEFPRSSSELRLQELANLCDMHITTVSRALDNKLCATPTGLVPLRKLVAGLL